MYRLYMVSVLLCGAHLVTAHTRFTTLHINGVSQGDGTCIRQDSNPGTTTSFVPSITGSEMACGVDGSVAVAQTCPLSAGDQIGLEHRMWPDGSQPGAIDVSHKGNTAIYMKKVGSMSDEVTGGGWFKIYWDGYNAATGQWGTDNMNANNGLVSTNVPSDLAAGDYLIRSEVLALQELGNPQMYVGCAQVQLSGSGSGNPSNTVSIPGYIDTSTSAMQVNIYESFTFQEYGPTLYGSDGSNSTSSGSMTTAGGKSGRASASPSASAKPTSVDSIRLVSTRTPIPGVPSSSDEQPTSASSNAEDTPGELSVDNTKTSSNIRNGGEDEDTSVSEMDADQHSWRKWNNVHARKRRSMRSI